jgi:2-isopropylmalate synthase
MGRLTAIFQAERILRWKSRTPHTTIPPNYPVIAEMRFGTATGVHAAAIVKAFHKGNVELANIVYSGVPSYLLGWSKLSKLGR